MLHDYLSMCVSVLKNQSSLLESSTESHQAGSVEVRDDHYCEPTKLLPEIFLQKDVEVERWLPAWGENQYGDGYCDDPSFGPLVNAVFNAASKLIIPVDAGFFALMGIKELLAEVAEIKQGTNQKVEVLGYLLTMADQTRMTQETLEGMKDAFGSLVFKTSIRRTVKLREAPALGKTIFHHDPEGGGALDYIEFSNEVLSRLGLISKIQNMGEPVLHLVQGVDNNG